MTHTPSTLKALASLDTNSAGCKAYFNNCRFKDTPTTMQGDWKAAQKVHKRFVVEASKLNFADVKDRIQLVNKMLAEHGIAWTS